MRKRGLSVAQPDFDPAASLALAHEITQAIKRRVRN
jgi:hypothetical protein